ncbi:c-type cytochrome [Deinococcus budaensis]|uniref:Mono/diheme cytochrome c family protein n=1 Tax=Deinococcus budaensis TaxID=1665626 RepID=A0A7W8GF96_9DEIO|nr:cytochrome c [Deinococcus budaensis]MBB5234403.1 mono/diheme cytochrome c family protein [Deinococcus budaensis]
MKRTSKNRWVAGDVMSWVLGVTLGVILGVALLIVAPRLGGAQGDAAPSAEGTIAASDERAGNGSAGEGQAAAGEAAGGQAGGAAQPGEGSDEGTGRSTEAATTDEPTAGSETAQATGSAGGVQAGGEGAADSDPTGTDSTSEVDQTGAEATVAPDGNTSADRERAQGEVGTAQAQNTGEGDTAQEAVTGQPTTAAGDAGAGQAIYVSNCQGCHGEQGQGVVGPSLVQADGPKSWTLAQFTTTLREGRTPERQLSAAMPRYSEQQISDAQVADLHAYIKTLN